MTLNFNHIRTLAKKQKDRPILQCLYYNDNKITFTDSYLLLQIDSKHGLNNTSISLLNHSINDAPYPNLTQIMSKGHEPRHQQQIIHNNGIAYINKLQDSTFIIDSEILDSIKKLLNIKDIDVNDFTFYGSSLKYKPSDDITIIHMMKRYNA